MKHLWLNHVKSLFLEGEQVPFYAQILYHLDMHISQIPSISPLISPLISSLKVDASATRPGYVNWTPLHLAAVRGYTEILQVLLKAKACVGAGSLEVEDLHQLNEA